MEFALPADIEAQIVAILNAAKTYGGAITTQARTAGEITAARISAGKEVLRAIFSNPQSEYYGEFVDYATVAHNALLPLGKTYGVPLIVPFDGADERDAIPADVDEIDAYRTSPEMFTGQVDGIPVPHNEADTWGRLSPISARYNITGRRLKFTGFSAKVPLLPEITDVTAGTMIPEGVSPTVVKRAVGMLPKEGDNLIIIARELAADGKQDLVEIAGGAMRVRPVRAVADIIAEQKMN